MDKYRLESESEWCDYNVCVYVFSITTPLGTKMMDGKNLNFKYSCVGVLTVFHCFALKGVKLI